MLNVVGLALHLLELLPHVGHLLLQALNLPLDGGYGTGIGRDVGYIGVVHGSLHFRDFGSHVALHLHHGLPVEIESQLSSNLLLSLDLHFLVAVPEHVGKELLVLFQHGEVLNSVD